MRIGSLDTNTRVVVVAEVGNNHEGDSALAEELVHLAADAGADAVKLQTFNPDHYASSRDAERLARLRKFTLAHDAVRHLAAVARDVGIVFFSTPFDLGSVSFLEPIVPVFKTASGDITFYPLLDAVAATGKPVILSTGTATLDEVAAAVARVRTAQRAVGTTADLSLLHCVAAYPVPPEQANLRAITALRERFPDCTIGYSDHTMGDDAAVAAIALGARIIEKHFTIAHDHSDFRDHQLSATLDELRQLITRVRTTESMLGSGVKQPQPCEEQGRVAFRRSIAAAQDLPAGTVLAREHLTWVRPASGIPPGYEHEVIGKVLREPVPKGVIIERAWVAEAVVQRA